jgi:hypothetical protein
MLELSRGLIPRERELPPDRHHFNMCIPEGCGNRLTISPRPFQGRKSFDTEPGVSSLCSSNPRLSSGNPPCCPADISPGSETMSSALAPVLFLWAKISRRFRHDFALQRLNHALKNQFAIIAAEHRFAGAFRMRHQARDIAAFVANSGDTHQ